MGNPDIKYDKENIDYKNLPVLQVREDFDDRLRSEGISDPLNDSRLSYEPYGSQYVFSLDNQKAFIVPNYNSLIAYLKLFYEKGKQQEQSVYIESIRNTEGILKLKAMISANPAVKNRADAQARELDDASYIDTALARTQNLTNFFKDQRNLSNANSGWWRSFSATKLERLNWKGQKNASKNILELLDNVEDSLLDIKNGKHIAGQTPEETLQTIKQHSALLTELERAKADFLSQKGDIEQQNFDSVPYYPTLTNTIPQARTLKNLLKKEGKQYGLLNKQELNAAQKILLVQDLERLDNYLDAVINNPDKTNITPFQPIHSKDFKQLVSLDPTLKEFFSPKEAVPTTATTAPQENTPKTANQENQTAETTPTSVREAFEKQGLNGVVNSLLDKTNMTPDQKQFWGGAANLAMWGGIAFVGLKFLKNIFRSFSKNGRAEMAKDGGRGWIVGPLAVFFGANAWKGESPLSLLNGGKITESISGIFGKKDRNTSSAEALTYSEGFPGATALFAGKTYPQMAAVLETNSDGKMRIKPDQYDGLISGLENDPDPKKKAAANFLKSIEKEDSNGMMDLALTGMGLSMDKLTNPANEKATFNEASSQAIGRVAAVAETMNRNGYDKILPEQMPMIKQYISTGEPSIEDIETRGDVFQKNSELPPQATQDLYRQKIDTLNIQDPKQKTDLLNALNKFYAVWPTTEAIKAGLDMKLDGTGKVLFSTYGESTPIDINNKSVAGINFDTYTEAMKVANLTNRIKAVTKDKKALSDKPFYINPLERDIFFDDTSKVDPLKRDTEIGSAGRGGNLQKISAKLEDNKQTYVDYLNAGRFWNGAGTSTGIELPTVLTSAVASVGLSNVASGNNNAEGSSENRIETSSLSPEQEKKLLEHKTNLDTLLTNITNPEEKQKIRDAFERFYLSFGKNSAPELKLSASDDGSKIKLKSYEEDITINFANKKLDNLNIQFDSYEDLFNAANFTNNIISISKDKNHNDNFMPFARESSILPLGIKFDDTKVLEMGLDTRVVSGSGLKQVSEQLNKSGNLDLYVNHLNDLWLNKKNPGILHSLKDLSPDEKTAALSGLKAFLDEKNKDNNPGAVSFDNLGQMISRNQTTPFNLKTLSLLDTIPMDRDGKTLEESYKNLFLLTDRINQIKETFKNKPAYLSPFNLSWGGAFGGDIEFDVGQFGQYYNDDTAISSGDLVDLNKNFDSTAEKDKLVNHLNTWFNALHPSTTGTGTQSKETQKTLPQEEKKS